MDVVARLWVLFLAGFLSVPIVASTISGHVADPQDRPVAGATVTLLAAGTIQAQVKTDAAGVFSLTANQPGAASLLLQAKGFMDFRQPLRVTLNDLQIDLKFTKLASEEQLVNVTADVKTADILFPDPAQRIYVREDLLDANPGRPGAPISIPGLPAETASSGIKAPQYFAPGVAGDHGEPISQYLQIGSYLVPNNLSANAHGNGYADPNIMIAPMIESVQIDGGAFNVREGNHSVDLAAIYGFHSRLEPFVTVTGDYRDIDITAGWSPGNPQTRAWIAIEASYGNGFLDTLEHRQQYKVNGYRVWDIGHHTITLFGIGYFGTSKIPGLVPIGVPNLHDTIDSRQRDQTHTGELAFNDIWHLTSTSELQLSSFFRTYNLSLSSNFGDGLIRQSEFRTVNGENANYIRRFNEAFSVMAGFDYLREAPRRLNLDHYDSTDPAVYGSFQTTTSNNVTLNMAAPYLAIDGRLTSWLRYNAGWRRDEIGFENTDLLDSLNSSHRLLGVNSPKGTLSLDPPDSLFLPSVSFSFGQAFFTNDPRIGTGTAQGTPVSRAHSYQMVVSKTIIGTDFRVTLGRVTQEQSLAKIDPDTGLQFDEGPSRNRYITIAARHYFHGASLQASVSKADARDVSEGLPIPEAPRLIFDALGTLDRLPFHLHARAEYEQVGRKPLDDGFVSVPVKEFRGALVRPFGRMEIGVNFLLASGYTGQTTEVLALPGELTPFERVTGVYLPSYVTLSWSYRFRPRQP